MTTVPIKIYRAKAIINVDLGSFPENVTQKALAIGIRELLNRKMSKLQVLSRMSEAERDRIRGYAVEQAERNLADLHKGVLPGEPEWEVLS